MKYNFINESAVSGIKQAAILFEKPRILFRVVEHVHPLYLLGRWGPSSMSSAFPLSSPLLLTCLGGSALATDATVGSLDLSASIPSYTRASAVYTWASPPSDKTLHNDVHKFDYSSVPLTTSLFSSSK
jgi:hypothetical protein